MAAEMQPVYRDQYFDLFKEQYEPIVLANIPEPFKADIEQFMFGRTAIKINGLIAFYPSDFNEWIEKVKTEGLSYDLQLL
ncbi:MAG: hypothetical protein ACFHWX_18305 [Bacteroidota bacterium]